MHTPGLHLVLQAGVVHLVLQTRRDIIPPHGGECGRRKLPLPFYLLI